jgi:glycosyltransferase involved in cell wall biosynthesis
VPLDPGVRLLAAGPRLAGTVRAWYGRDATVLPVPVPRLAHAPERVREQVTFLDPRPAGGVEILFDIAAARPDIRFVVVETERLSDTWRATCFERAFSCGNIDWRSGQVDLGRVLAAARLLLAPLLAPDADAWPIRVAQALGVPALATNHGIVAETVGAGGLVVAPHAGPDAWLAAFDVLWSDAPHARAVAAVARQASAAAADDIASALLDTITAASSSARVA